MLMEGTLRTSIGAKDLKIFDLKGSTVDRMVTGNGGVLKDMNYRLWDTNPLESLRHAKVKELSRVLDRDVKYL